MNFTALIEVFSLEFMQTAAVMSLCLGVLGGLAGTVVVIQRSAMQVESFAHALLPGLILSYLWLGRSWFSLVVGGILSLTITRLLSLIFALHHRTDANTGSAIVIALNFSVGLILLSVYQQQLPIALDHFILGDLLAVSWEDVVVVLLALIVMMLGVFLFYRPLKAFLLDPEYTGRRGWPFKRTTVLLQILIVVAALLSFQSVGFILTLALLTVPTATVQLYARHLWHMFVYGSILGACEGLAGLVFSYIFNLPSAPTIIIVSVFIYALILATHFLQSQKRQARNKSLQLST